MSVTILSTTTKSNYVEMEWDKYGVYKVHICPVIGEGMCGYPTKEQTYSENDKKKAIATYKRYVKEVTKDEDIVDSYKDERYL